MPRIEYNLARNEAKQYVTSLGSTFHLEFKSLSEIIEELEEIQVRYLSTQKLKGEYCDGYAIKEVKFDRLELRFESDYGDDKYFYIYGFRRLDDSEKKALEAEEAATKFRNLEYKRKEYERLKKELGE